MEFFAGQRQENVQEGGRQRKEVVGGRVHSQNPLYQIPILSVKSTPNRLDVSVAHAFCAVTSVPFAQMLLRNRVELSTLPPPHFTAGATPMFLTGAAAPLDIFPVPAFPPSWHRAVADFR
jgi:hypothetical protein